MDLIILGFLMLKGANLYELRSMIGNSLSTVSSDSTGSIQSALQKLLKKEMVTFEEKTEKGINKKTYFITKKGIDYFETNIAKPMLYKEKNMEMSKFFFMGFIDKEQQLTMIDGYIKELEKELEKLKEIDRRFGERYQFPANYGEQLIENGGVSDYLTEDGIQAIAHFQYGLLDLGMEKLLFEIEWFNKFKAKLDEGDKNDS
ncbi:PadR family transcriptional regulator [Enterococcus hulanensis]|uniref:PadR family transcriptional regulator n=1 Tax=Enterococcus hulanensis TaxID=2559929 RepID=UPI00288CD88C|nr:PadR family transcriptional regulator [Enterococcus hulanensis]MDT2659691.1 PadR family transcriptional regulator [Enterococcus hulanensis]